MNFLAHLVLSADNEDLIIGNFIADSVRSSQWDRFTPLVVEGIKLHHKIDGYTDTHPLVEKSKERLRPSQGRYSPVVVDIFYDHFLARHFSRFHEKDLGTFTRECYRLFRKRWDELPAPVQRMLPFMENNNWLKNYGNEEGLRKVFNGMSRRANFENNMARAVDDLLEDYGHYEREFLEFFPALEGYVSEEIRKISYL